MSDVYAETLKLALMSPVSTVLPQDSISQVGQPTSPKKTSKDFGISHALPRLLTFPPPINSEPRANVAQWISDQQGEALLAEEVQHDPFLAYILEERQGLAVMSGQAREDARLSYMRIQEEVCYEQEGNFVAAYTSFLRAVCLIPPGCRDIYWSKLFSLKDDSNNQQARFSTANVKSRHNPFASTDPFDILPLEIITEIMRFGQASDSKFVLRATWVNSKWRETLTQSCPSLWNKVCFDGVAKGNTKLFDEYARACIKRSRGNLDIAVFRNFSIGSLNRLWMTLQTLPWTAKTLGVEFTGSQVLESFSTLFRPNMANLRHLLIRCDSIRARTPPKLLTCTDLVSPDKLETLDLDGVYFRTLNAERTITASELKSFRDDIIQYPRLKSLTVHRCAFDGSYAPSLLGDSREYQIDQLHRALRGALGIEFLEVTEPVVGVKMAQPGVGKRITLLQVRELVVPPPSIWSIDILAPHLESLSFASARKSRIEWCLQVARKKHSALIPTIAEAPITLDTLPRLKQVEFFCYEYDQISRLEEWLSQLPNITKLVIIAGKAGNPWPRQANGGSFDFRARMQVLQLLIDHPEWCPELEDLELHACFASGRKLVEFVRNRTKATNCASLRRLALKESLALSAEAFLTLCNEVPEFSHSSYEEPGGSDVARRRRECQQEQYMLDDFEFEPCEILDDQSPCMAYDQVPPITDDQVPWLTDDQVPWLTDDLVMTLDIQTPMPDLLGADNIVEAFKLQKQYEIGRLPDGETTSGSTARSNCHSEETWDYAIKAKPKTSDSD